MATGLPSLRVQRLWVMLPACHRPSTLRMVFTSVLNSHHFDRYFFTYEHSSQTGFLIPKSILATVDEFTCTDKQFHKFGAKWPVRYSSALRIICLTWAKQWIDLSKVRKIYAWSVDGLNQSVFPIGILEGSKCRKWKHRKKRIPWTQLNNGWGWSMCLTGTAPLNW